MPNVLAKNAAGPSERRGRGSEAALRSLLLVRLCSISELRKQGVQLLRALRYSTDQQLNDRLMKRPEIVRR